MSAPTQANIDVAICSFIDRTGNDALRVVPCAVCARKTSMRDITQYALATIPNSHLLRPRNTHPKHDIYDTMLLYPPGVINDKSANICNGCCNRLYQGNTPKYALANDMWIGAIPMELDMLTLPEQMLIVMYYPVAYIFKLYPKKKNKGWNPKDQYRAMKGNVTTYHLDPKQVVNMLDGKKMPRPPKILASTIGVTFLTPAGIPENKIPKMFRVQRHRV